jgi:hypothetical protein
VLAVIRKVFGNGSPRERETALHELAEALGYGRVGSRIRALLEDGLRTALRRGILHHERGEFSLLCRSIEGYERDFLKQQFVAAIGRTWTGRDGAARTFARWLGFTRTGETIAQEVRSLITGLLRERRLERDGTRIRRT